MVGYDRLPRSMWRKLVLLCSHMASKICSILRILSFISLSSASTCNESVVGGGSTSTADTKLWEDRNGNSRIWVFVGRPRRRPVAAGAGAAGTVCVAEVK